MGKFYWLVSYPKSGNTWLRILLTNYSLNAGTPADINDLQINLIASSRMWFDEWAGVEASTLDNAVIERLRPYVYRCMADEVQDTLCIKVHDAWNLTDRGEPLFPADVTAGVIYVLRNPLDMAASCAHHWGVDLEQAVANLCDSDFAISKSLVGMADQLSQRLGSWTTHVRSWLDESGLPVRLVRYEDLQADAVSVFGNVVKFCGFPYNAERVRKAVTFSDFRELQRQESEKRFRERLLKATGGFFRRGESGSWREELPPHLVQKLIDAHGETMRHFGYLDEHNNPV